MCTKIKVYVKWILVNSSKCTVKTSHRHKILQFSTVQYSSESIAFFGSTNYEFLIPCGSHSWSVECDSSGEQCHHPTTKCQLHIQLHNNLWIVLWRLSHHKIIHATSGGPWKLDSKYDILLFNHLQWKWFGCYQLQWGIHNWYRNDPKYPANYKWRYL